jgi:hypothetical protein
MLDSQFGGLVRLCLKSLKIDDALRSGHKKRCLHWNVYATLRQPISKALAGIALPEK